MKRIWLAVWPEDDYGGHEEGMDIHQKCVN